MAGMFARRNVIERAVLQAKGKTIGLRDLHFDGPLTLALLSSTRDLHHRARTTAHREGTKRREAALKRRQSDWVYP
jgi:hypothetical protein